MVGFFSAPNEAGVSDCTISRIGTRRSRRDPSTYILREFGIGLTAASSTRAVSAINFGLAFMALLSRTHRRERRTSRSTLPCGGIIRIRFEGFALTRQGKFARPGPLRCSEGPYSKRWGVGKRISYEDVLRM